MDNAHALANPPAANSNTLPAGFPNIQISNPTVSHKGSLITVKGDVEISSLNIPGLPLSALLSLLPNPGSVTTTITMNNGGIDAKDAKYTVAFKPANFKIPINSSSKLQVNDPKIIITALPKAEPPSASFKVTGTFPITLFKSQTYQAKMTMSVSDGKGGPQAGVSLDVDFPSNGIELPDDLNDFITIKNLDASMGVIFDPPGCFVGVGGVASIGSNHKSSNATIVIDLDGEIPLYISFGTESFQHFSDFTETILPANSYSDELIEFGHSKIESITWCGKKIDTLPNGQTAVPGFSCLGYLEMLLGQCYGILVVVNKKSIKGDFQTSQVDLCGNAIALAGNGKTIQRRPISNRITPKTSSQVKARTEAPNVLVQAGGPVLAFAMSKEDKPSLQLDAEVSLFGIKKNISTTMGRSFPFDFGDMNGLANGTSFQIFPGGKIEGIITFSPPVNIPIRLGILGKINPANQSIITSISCRNGSTLECSISMNLLGTTTCLGQYNLINVSTLTDFIQKITEYVTNHQEGLINFLEEDPKRWLNALKEGAILLKDPSPNNVLQAMYQCGIGATQVASQIDEFCQILPVLKNSGIETWIQGMQNVFPDHLGEAGVVVNKVLNVSASEIATAYESIGIKSKYAAQAFHLIGTHIKDAAPALKTAYKISAQTVGNLLKGAGYPPSEIVSVFKSLGGDFRIAAHNIIHDLDPRNW